MATRHRIAAFATLIALLAGLLLPGPARAYAASHPFVDLAGIPQESQISTLYDLKIVSGVSATAFNPRGPVTRAHMATMIIKALGRTAEADALMTVPSEFRDVGAAHWARGYITLAHRMGIIRGDGERYYPENSVNYAQAATMLIRALGYETHISGGYPDGFVAKAADLGLFHEAAFELYAGVTRAEAAVLLYNAIFRAPAAAGGLTLSQSRYKRPVRITIDPLPAYAAPGQQLTVKATPRDLAGNPLDLAVTLSGNIKDGKLTVTDGGPIAITAALGELSASATVTPIRALKIEPESFQASKGGTVTLKATAMAGDQRVVVTPEWAVAQGPAQIDKNGLLAVSDYGTVQVKATYGTLTATATGQAVGKVTIGSRPDYIIPGKSTSFTAAAVDSTGQPSTAPVTWTATGATIDKITGVLMGPTGNTVTVTATAGGISDAVTVPVLKEILVTPNLPTVLSGTQYGFKAQAKDGTGRLHDITPVWDVSDRAKGILSADGAFVGIGTGNLTVTATLGSLVGRLQFRISGPPVKLSVTAINPALPAGRGATTPVTVRLLDAAGLLSPMDDQPIVLTVAGSGSLQSTILFTRGGEATTSFTAGDQAGPAVVTAAAPGTQLQTQSLALTAYAQSPGSVVLSALPSPLATGGNIGTITATLRDSNGFTALAPTAQYIALSMAGSGGTLAAPTITIPAGASSGTVSIISSSQPGAVQITGTAGYPVSGTTIQMVAVGPVVGVRIRPPGAAVPVTGLNNLTLCVDVVDANGVVMAGDHISQVKLTAEPPSGPPLTLTATATRGTAAFTVPAYSVGTVPLTAALVGVESATHTENAVFVPGVFSALRLTPQPATIVADGISTTQIVAEVVDRNGAVMSHVTGPVIFRKIGTGASTQAASELAGTLVGGRAALTVRSTANTGADLWYAATPGIETQNLATVTVQDVSTAAYSLFASSPATSYRYGSAVTVWVRVMDNQGGTLAADNGRLVSATLAGPGLLSAAQAATVAGIATFTVTGINAGTVTLTFTSAGLPQSQAQLVLTFTN